MKNNLREYIREGRDRCDLTRIFLNPDILTACIQSMSAPFIDQRVDKVAALDSLGFIFGARVAQELNSGLVLIRKGGKIGIDNKSVYFTDYTGNRKSLEIAIDSIDSGEQVLIVDDWSETGAQLKAAIDLVEEIKGNVIGIACLNIEKPVFEDPKLKKYKLHSIINY